MSRHRVRSSLPYQMLLYANGWYYPFFFLAEILLFIYKGTLLPYPSRSLSSEVILLIVLSAVEVLRNFFGKKGNLTESSSSVIASLVLSIPCLVSLVYFLLWQTYVLWLEIIILGIQISFVTLEIIFAGVAMISFARD